MGWDDRSKPAKSRFTPKTALTRGGVTPFEKSAPTRANTALQEPRHQASSLWQITSTSCAVPARGRFPASQGASSQDSGRAEAAGDRRSAIDRKLRSHPSDHPISRQSGQGLVCKSPAADAVRSTGSFPTGQRNDHSTSGPELFLGTNHDQYNLPPDRTGQLGDDAQLLLCGALWDIDGVAQRGTRDRSQVSR